MEWGKKDGASGHRAGGEGQGMREGEGSFSIQQLPNPILLPLRFPYTFWSCASEIDQEDPLGKQSLPSGQVNKNYFILMRPL